MEIILTEKIENLRYEKNIYFLKKQLITSLIRLWKKKAWQGYRPINTPIYVGFIPTYFSLLPACGDSLLSLNPLSWNKYKVKFLLLNKSL